MATGFRMRRLFAKEKLLLSVVCTSCRSQSTIHKKGIPQEFFRILYQDIDFRPKTVRNWFNRQKWNQLKKEHAYQKDNVQAMGPDIAAAQFIVQRGGAVKFVGRDKWYRRTEEGANYLPIRFISDFSLEAIDASNTNMMYCSFDNLANLPDLMYMNLSHCPHVDDWCLARFHMFADNLRFLDLSGCPGVTERGLATLHHLQNLEGLKVADMPNVDNKELVMILLEEMLPKCCVVGVNYATGEQSKSKPAVQQMKTEKQTVEARSEILTDKSNPS